MKILGLDTSLSCTGVAGRGWTDVIRTPAKLRGPARHNLILQELMVHFSGVDLVVIEGGAYSRNAQAGHEELIGLRQMIYHKLWTLDIPYAIISPTTRAKYATGKGNADKDTVWREVQWRYGIIMEDPGKFDQADALTLCAMGWHWVGASMGTPPEGFSLAGKWPDEAVAEVLRERAAAYARQLRDPMALQHVDY